SKGRLARSGRNKKMPPNLVRRRRGERSSWSQSAVAAFATPAPALLITTARQACKALLFENHGAGGRAEVSSGLAQCLTDVVDGEVLLAHPYDPFAEWIRFWRGLRALGDWGKKLRVGVVPKLMT